MQKVKFCKFKWRQRIQKISKFYKFWRQKYKISFKKNSPQGKVCGRHDGRSGLMWTM